MYHWALRKDELCLLEESKRIAVFSCHRRHGWCCPYSFKTPGYSWNLYEMLKSELLARVGPLVALVLLSDLDAMFAALPQWRQETEESFKLVNYDHYTYQVRRLSNSDRWVILSNALSDCWSIARRDMPKRIHSAEDGRALVDSALYGLWVAEERKKR